MRRLTTVIVAGGLAFGGTAATAEAASAPKLVRVSHTVVLGAAQSGFRSVAARCPRGYRVISGTGAVGSATAGTPADAVRAHAWLTGAQPFHGRSGDGYTATARNFEWSKSWALTAAATCAKGLSGVAIVHRTSKAVGDGAKKLAVNCARGARVLGFGGRVDYTGAEVNGFGPASSGKAGYASAVVADGDSPSNWRLTTYAVCAKAPKGWRITTAAATFPKSVAGGVGLDCPKGTRAYGSGGQTLPATPHRSGGEVRLNLPANAHGTTAVGAFDLSLFGTLYAWKVQAFAVCAK